MLKRRRTDQRTEVSILIEKTENKQESLLKSNNEENDLDMKSVNLGEECDG